MTPFTTYQHPSLKHGIFSTRLLKYLNIFSQATLDFMDFLVSPANPIQVSFRITMLTISTSKLSKIMHLAKYKCIKNFSNRSTQYILDDTFSLLELIPFWPVSVWDWIIDLPYQLYSILNLNNCLNSFIRKRRGPQF